MFGRAPRWRRRPPPRAPAPAGVTIPIQPRRHRAQPPQPVAPARGRRPSGRRATMTSASGSASAKASPVGVRDRHPPVEPRERRPKVGGVRRIGREVDQDLDELVRRHRGNSWHAPRIDREADVAGVRDGGPAGPGDADPGVDGSGPGDLPVVAARRRAAARPAAVIDRPDPLRLTSIMNWAPRPKLCVQVMACTVPTVQATTRVGRGHRDAPGDQGELAAQAAGGEHRSPSHAGSRSWWPARRGPGEAPGVGRAGGERRIGASAVAAQLDLRRRRDNRFVVQVIVWGFRSSSCAAAGDVTASAGLPIANAPLVARPQARRLRRDADDRRAGRRPGRGPRQAAGGRRRDASVVQVAPPRDCSSTRTVVPAGRLLEDHEIVRASRSPSSRPRQATSRPAPR